MGGWHSPSPRHVLQLEPRDQQMQDVWYHETQISHHLKVVKIKISHSYEDRERLRYLILDVISNEIKMTDRSTFTIARAASLTIYEDEFAFRGQ